MDSFLQIVMFLLTTIIVVMLITLMIKHRMNIRYTIVWTLAGIAAIILTIFPGLIDVIAKVLHIGVPVNALFLIVILLLYCISFYLFLKTSEQANQIKSLGYEIALLKKEIEDSKNEREK